MSARCLFFLDGGKREENPMSHTPLHRATVLPLNTTPRGALRPPSSPSATKNKLARCAVRSSGCPRARAREHSPSPHSRTLALSLSYTLSFALFLSLSLSHSLALSLVFARASRLVNATDTFIRAFRPLSRTFSRTSRALHDRPTARFPRIEEVALCRHSPPLVAAATTTASTIAFTTASTIASTTTATSTAAALDSDGEDGARRADGDSMYGAASWGEMSTCHGRGRGQRFLRGAAEVARRGEGEARTRENRSTRVRGWRTRKKEREVEESNERMHECEAKTVQEAVRKHARMHSR